MIDMPIKIDYKKCCWKNGKCTSCSCKGSCKGCLYACPVNAITREDIVKVDKTKCIECGACVVACEHHAISLK